MKSYYYRLALIGAICAVGLVPCEANTLAWFGEPVQAQDGWEQSSWFGWYKGGQAPFIYHANHGWIYVQEAGSWLWIWDYGINEWIATSSSSYPLMYEPLGDNWMWYYEGTMGPRWFGEFSSGEYYKDYSGVLMPDEMEEMLSGINGVSEQANNGEFQEQMTQIMEIVSVVMEAGTSASVCPIIVMSPEEIDLGQGLPPSIFFSVDFGDGCEPVPDMGLIGGSLVIDVTNLLMTESDISAVLTLDADGLSLDGVPVLDGMLTANMNIGVSRSESSTSTHWVNETQLDLDIEMTLDDFTAAEDSLSGVFMLDGVYITTEYENSMDWEDVSTVTSADLTLGLSNVVAGELTVSSGSISLVVSEEGDGIMESDFNTNEGEMHMALSIGTSEDGSLTEISTVDQGNLAGYGLTIDNLVFDTNQCETYPVSGIITALHQGVVYTLTVTGDCDGKFRMQKK